MGTLEQRIARREESSASAGSPITIIVRRIVYPDNLEAEARRASVYGEDLTRHADEDEAQFLERAIALAHVLKPAGHCIPRITVEA